MLPANIRHILGIKGDNQLVAETTADGLLLRPAVTAIEIYSDQRIRAFDEAELAKELTRRHPRKKSAR